jgi:hypothetical protein
MMPCTPRLGFALGTIESGIVYRAEVGAVGAVDVRLGVRWTLDSAGFDKYRFPPTRMNSCCSHLWAPSRTARTLEAVNSRTEAVGAGGYVSWRGSRIWQGELRG